MKALWRRRTKKLHKHRSIMTTVEDSWPGLIEILRLTVSNWPPHNYYSTTSLNLFGRSLQTQLSSSRWFRSEEIPTISNPATVKLGCCKSSQVQSCTHPLCFSHPVLFAAIYGYQNHSHCFQTSRHLPKSKFNAMWFWYFLFYWIRPASRRLPCTANAVASPVPERKQWFLMEFVEKDSKYGSINGNSLPAKLKPYIWLYELTICQCMMTTVLFGRSSDWHWYAFVLVFSWMYLSFRNPRKYKTKTKQCVFVMCRATFRKRTLPLKTEG